MRKTMRWKQNLAILLLSLVCAVSQVHPVYAAAAGEKTRQEPGKAAAGKTEAAAEETETLAGQSGEPADKPESGPGDAADGPERELRDAADGQETEPGNAADGQETEPGDAADGQEAEPGDVTGIPGTEPGDAAGEPGAEDGEPAKELGEPADGQEGQSRPGKVSGLRTTRQSDKKVLLEWYDSEGAESYRVYRRTGSGDYKMLGKATAGKYVDKTIVYGKTYRYKVTAVSADGVEGKAATISFSHTQAVNIVTQKYTYSQMEADMEELLKAYSNYCELVSIGTSVEGREIFDFAIGNPDASRSLLVVSTLHAREYICSAVLMREIEYYLRYYNKEISGTKPADVLDDLQIHYVVMANPDGVTISQTRYARWKANGRGVDLNRNFPAEKFVVGGKRGPEGYSGKKALSEPESKAIATLTKDLKKNQGLLGVVNYHAMGQIVFGDCSAAKIKKATTTMYQIARGLTGYSSAAGYGSGGRSSGGQYREYVMDLLELPSITIEIGHTWAPCSYSEYESAFQKNKLVVLKIAEAL